jgi:tRNA(fMet)-specific endonuclease VapC
MTYLLDTNTIIRYLNGRAPNMRVRLSAIPLTELAVSTIVVAELRYGAAKSMNPTKALTIQDQLLNLIDVIPFDQAGADAYGQIRATLEHQGRPIGANDLLIAATALSRQMTLVTHNTGEFSRVAGLLLDDWE